MSSDTPYTVSVRLMTYNHAKYIREAIESILAQQTDFNVEVVVGDDFSTDGTLDIVREYQSTEKIHIRILERRVGDEYWTKRQKLGRLYNFINIIENCTGEYIALLDGDDYWMDPFKLKKQVECFSANGDVHLCCSNAYVLDNSSELKLYSSLKGGKVSILCLLKKNPFSTASALIRREALCGINEFVYKSPFGDWALYWTIAMYMKFVGSFYFIDEPLVAYRKHLEGLYSRMDPVKRARQYLIFYHHLDKFTAGRFTKEITAQSNEFKRKILYMRWRRFVSRVKYILSRVLFFHLPVNVKG